MASLNHSYGLQVYLMLIVFDLTVTHFLNSLAYLALYKSLVCICHQLKQQCKNYTVL